MDYYVFQGKRITILKLPGRWSVTEVLMPQDLPLRNPETTMLDLLRNPIDSPPLSEIVKPGHQIAVCVTDSSRSSPDNILLPPLLLALENAGVHRNNITIIVGTGTHRPLTFDDMKAKYGYFASTYYRIVNHNCLDSFNLADLGRTPSGVPVVLNKILTMVDHVINLTVVEPHQYAGYSGGAKTIAVGCAGEETIKHTHSADFIEKAGISPGKVEDNFFQEVLWEIVKPVNFSFSVNTIVNDRGDVLDIQAGHPKSSFFKAVQKAKSIFEYYSKEKFDIAYLGVPHPKDLNLYLASRAATYQALSESPVFRKGAVLNLMCTCPEGIGKGAGEIRFKERMTKFPNPAAILLSMTRRSTLPGEQRAFMTAKAMMDFKINVTGTSIPKEDLEAMGFLAKNAVPDDIKNSELKAIVLRDGMKMILKYSGDKEDHSPNENNSAS